MTCMHPYRVWNIGPPSLMLHYHRVSLFAFQIFFVLLICQLICVLTLHSNVNAVPILGCPRRLLLSLFIKDDYASKCGVAWFIILLAIQNLICSSDCLTCSHANLPLKCKCSAHSRLSKTITAFVIYQA